MIVLKTFLLALMPILELRAAIPYGIFNGGNIFVIFIIAVIGNMLPVIFLLLFLPMFEKYCRNKFGSSLKFFFDLPYSFYRWLRRRTYRKHKSKFNNLGAIALIIFVAVPLPLTGAWSGALAAHIFDIPSKKAFFLILTGVIIAGLLVTTATLGIKLI